MGMKLWVCSDCGFSRHGKWDVRRHIEQKHLEIFIQCQLCIATFTRRDKYRAHLKKHSEQPWTCNINFTGALGSLINSMMFQSMTNNGEKLWCCSYCDFKTKKSTNIKDHIEAKHVSSRIQCNLCSADFTTSSYLKKHIKKAHTNLLF